MSSEPPEITVVPPGDGPVGDLGSIGVVFKLWGHDTAGPPPPADIMALAGRYGLRFGRPDWLPGLITRYGLAPPPGA